MWCKLYDGECCASMPPSAFCSLTQVGVLKTDKSSVSKIINLADVKRKICGVVQVRFFATHHFFPTFLLSWIFGEDWFARFHLTGSDETMLFVQLLIFSQIASAAVPGLGSWFSSFTGVFQILMQASSLMFVVNQCVFVPQPRTSFRIILYISQR